MNTAKSSHSILHRYPHIAGRVFDTPLLVEQSKLVTILNVLGDRFDFSVEVPDSLQSYDYDNPRNHLDAALSRVKVIRRDEGYFVVDGVALVPIVGTLVQRSDWMSSMSGMIGYSQVENMVSAAVMDNQVDEILLEIDSPGGEVPGVFDLADRLYDMRGEKPITAIASEFAASGAYLIASTADQIVVPRTGYVGSIGVVTAHTDLSRKLDKQGVAVTFIYAGDRKVEGNSYEPLAPEVRDRIQQEVNAVYDLFVDTVARNRGMSVAAVRETQAGMFMGSKAVEIGLADRVNSFTNELSNAALRIQTNDRQVRLSSPSHGVSKEKEQMSKPLITAAAQAAEQSRSESSQAPASADVAASQDTSRGVDDKAPAAQQTAESPAVSSQQMSEKDRIRAILSCDEAKGREDLAKHLAFSTDMSPEDVVALLSKSPKANALSNAMERYAPGVASGEVSTSESPVSMTSASEVYAFRESIFKAAREKQFVR